MINEEGRTVAVIVEIGAVKCHSAYRNMHGKHV